MCLASNMVQTFDMDLTQAEPTNKLMLLDKLVNELRVFNFK